MIRVAGLRQAIRLAELLSEEGDAEFFELWGNMDDDRRTVGVKVFCVDGKVKNFYINGDGDAPTIGSVGAWGIIRAERKTT